MSLSSSQLDAFAEVARTGGFSKAAKNLAITQSALSQRVMNLEDELGTALLIRETGGVRLTAAGEELLKYCQARTSMEEEALSRLKSKPRSEALTGIVRVAGYSTVMRSVVMPALSPLLVKNPQLRLEIITREMRDLPGLLRSGETDYVLLDHELQKEGIESALLGYEENVLVESASAKSVADQYLDHDLEDQTTHRFFANQERKPKKLNRSFLDEIYGILDAAAEGLGRAVVPRHLVRSDKRLRVVSGFKPMRVPVHLHFYQQPFYTRLQKEIVERLTAGAHPLGGK